MEIFSLSRELKSLFRHTNSKVFIASAVVSHSLQLFDLNLSGLICQFIKSSTQGNPNGWCLEANVRLNTS